MGEEASLLGLLFRPHQCRSPDGFACCFPGAHHGRTTGSDVPRGVAASFFMHQAEMATWGSFQGWFLFLQENSKNEFVLGRTLLEFIKAFC